MYVSRAFVRFYKSFNFDYLRRYNAEAEGDPWEDLDGAWYPFVRIGLEPDLTAIVGANESGKSHLLDAVEKAVTGEDIERSDFCRYSSHFRVEQGQLRLPDFGIEIRGMDASQEAAVRSALSLEQDEPLDPLWFFRLNGSEFRVYRGPERTPSPAGAKAIGALTGTLPNVVRMDAGVPLPDSIPYAVLLGGDRPRLSRRRFSDIHDVLESNIEWLRSAESLRGAAEAIFRAAQAGEDTVELREQERLQKAHSLARDLIFRVAKVDREAIADLVANVRKEKEGYVSGVVGEINDAIAKHLNLRRWWTQDRDFRLVVKAQERDLVLTVSDRTGREYSFDERSTGLKYFLSYLVQFLAHPPPADGRNEILMMDEPDAYLSSQGQQDVLRIFGEFARPTVLDRPPAQVMYVTHSPYLIDRNHAERIRALDKGSGEEGTRVIRDVAQNHYEPLRSAYGAFVAETAFIGGTNLFLEGLADQVWVAGMSSHLRRRGASATTTVDLNTTTLVPAGSAGEVPYLVHLARGRGPDRPAVVVLLDSDTAGDEARKRLRKKPTGQGRLLDDQLVLQVGEVANRVMLGEGVTLKELEDLVPIGIAAEAARRYAQFVGGLAAAKAAKLTDADLASQVSGSVWDAVSAAYASAFGEGAHIEKVGFARSALDTLVAPGDLGDEVELLGTNYTALFAELAARLRVAQRTLLEEKLGARIDRVKSRFLTDNPRGATRESGRMLIEEVLAVLDESPEAADVRAALEKLSVNFELSTDLTEPIADYDGFRIAVESVRYAGRLAAQASETGSGVAVDQTVHAAAPLAGSPSADADAG